MRPAVTDPEEAARLIDEANATSTEAAEEDVPAVTVINIDVKDGRRKRYAGAFYFRVPNIGDQIRIGQIKQAMLPGGSPDINATVLVDQLAYLQVVLTFSAEYPKPEWWKPTTLYDATPLTELYRRCLAYEAKFHGTDKEHRDDAGAAREEKPPVRDGDAPLGRKVRPAAQRRETLAGDDEGSP